MGSVEGVILWNGSHYRMLKRRCRVRRIRERPGFEVAPGKLVVFNIPEKKKRTQDGSYG